MGRNRSFCGFLILAAILLTAPRGEARCAGDCDGSETVAVNELVLMVSIALGLSPIEQCRAGDPGGDEEISVNELVMAVNRALSGCGSTPWPELEKAAGVAPSVLVSLFTALTALPVMGGEGGSASDGGGGRDDCPGGGDADVSCKESGGTSTITAFFDDCGLPDDETGLWITSDGKMVVTVDARGVCRDLEIPTDVRVTTKFTDFSASYSEWEGPPLTSVSLPDFTETVDPSGVGCMGSNGTFSMQGSFRVTVPESSVDIGGSASGLNLLVESSGFPCAVQATANGGIELEDFTTGRQFSASFAATRARFSEAADENVSATLDGPMTVSCIGDLTFETTEPLLLTGGACPLGGHVLVRMPDDRRGDIRYTPDGGLELDYEDDGTYDRTVNDCTDPSLSHCL